jgi:hypothetical protein
VSFITFPSQSIPVLILVISRSQCCFDVEKAIEITKEIWRRRDAGDTGDSWQSVCQMRDMDVLYVMPRSLRGQSAHMNFLRLILVWCRLDCSLAKVSKLYQFYTSSCIRLDTNENRKRSHLSVASVISHVCLDASSQAPARLLRRMQKWGSRFQSTSHSLTRCQYRPEPLQRCPSDVPRFICTSRPVRRETTETTIPKLR